MAVALALVSAVAFATGTVLQQRGALATPAGGEDARFLVQILREPARPPAVLRNPRRRRGPQRAARFSTASSNASTLVFSVLFGISVFGEELARGGRRVALAIIGLAVAVVSVTKLGVPDPAAEDPAGLPHAYAPRPS